MVKQTAVVVPIAASCSSQWLLKSAHPPKSRNALGGVLFLCGESPGENGLPSLTTFCFEQCEHGHAHSEAEIGRI